MNDKNIYNFTVGELIEILQQHHNDMPVPVSGYENSYENLYQPLEKKVIHLPENPYWNGQFQLDDNGTEVLLMEREVRNCDKASTMDNFSRVKTRGMKIKTWISRAKKLVAAILLSQAFPLISTATAPFSFVLESPRGVVTVAVHQEDASKMARVRALLEQDLPALEHAFGELLAKGHLNSNFPRLVIEASICPGTIQTTEDKPVIASLVENAILVCNNPDFQNFTPRHLGPAHLVQTCTSHLSFNSMLSKLLLINGLDETREVMEIGNHDLRENKKTSKAHQKYRNMEIPVELSHAGPGNYKLRSSWIAGTTVFELENYESEHVLTLDALDVYITPPSWFPADDPLSSPLMIGYASDSLIVLHDIKSGVSYRQQITSATNDNNPVQRVVFLAQINPPVVYAHVIGILGSHVSAYSLSPGGAGWQETYNDLEPYQVNDLFTSRQLEGVLIPFQPAFDSRETRNADIVIENRDQVNMVMEHQDETRMWKSVLALILIAFLAGTLTWYLKSKRKRNLKN